MPKRVIAKPTRAVSTEQLPRYVEEYLKERDAAATMQKRVDEKKANIVEVLIADGYTDDKGSRFVDVGIPGCSAVKHERRVRTVLDEEKALAWIKKHKPALYDSCTKTITVLDEEALLAAAYEGKIAEKTLKSFYEQSESFAFKIVP